MGTWTRRITIALIAVLALALAACGGDSDDTAAEDTGGEQTTAPADTDTGEPPAETDEPADDESPTEATGEPAGGATVAVATSELGDILVDGAGMTLYVFLPDDAGAPTCTDDCLQAWPLLEGPAEPGAGADAGLLATAEHPAGATQVTYNGWPLYYFANDESPGDTNGQGVGDNWYVIGPDGEPIQETSAASAGY